MPLGRISVDEDKADVVLGLDLVLLPAADVGDKPGQARVAKEMKAIARFLRAK